MTPVSRKKRAAKTTRKHREYEVVEYIMVLCIAIVALLLLDAFPYGKAPADFPSLPPHQFFGLVTCTSEGKVVPQNLQLAAVTTHVAQTANYTLNSTANITNATYGYYPQLFFTEGIENGDNISMYVGAELVHSVLFSSSEISETNITLSASCVDENVCGNSVCEASESCDQCVVDCGTCDNGGNGGGGNGNNNIINTTLNYTLQEGASLQTDSVFRNAVSGMLTYSLSDQQVSEYISQSEQISPYIAVSANIYSDQSSSVLTIRIRNLIGNQLRNFIVYEKLPKSFAQNTGNTTTIASDATYSTVRADPEYAFLYDTFDAGEIITIQHRKSKSSTASFLSSLAFEVYTEEIMSVQCTESESRCSGNDIESCVSGAWEITEHCGYRCTEFSNARCVAQFSDVCTEGELRCDGNDVQVCEADSWITQETCEYGCMNKACVSASPESRDFTIVIAALLAVAVIAIGYIAYRKLRKESDVEKIIRRVRESQAPPNY